MKNKRPAVVTLTVLGCLYLLLGLMVSLRFLLHPVPDRAAQAYVHALMERDVYSIYLYSDMLGPHLASMLVNSKLSDDARRHVWAKDFARWRTEFDKGSRATDSLKRERRLLHGQVEVEEVPGRDYKAEVKKGEELDLLSYTNVPGETHHKFYRISYPGPDQAPQVAILDNVRSGPKRRLRTLIVRVQVSRRPDVGSVRKLFMTWDWIDSLMVAFPHLALLPQPDPSAAWMVGVSFAVDKKTVETF